MIIRNLHVLSFSSLYKEIITKESLDYDFLKLRSDQLSDLATRGSSMMNTISKHLSTDSKVVGITTSSILWISSMKEYQLPELYQSYTYEHQFFTIGVYINARQYILWNGNSLSSKGSYLNRKDIANVCKYLLENKVRDVLFGTSSDIDLSPFVLDDYLFRYTGGASKILVSGRKVEHTEELLEDIDAKEYISFVDKYVQRLIM